MKSQLLATTETRWRTVNDVHTKIRCLWCHYLDVKIVLSLVYARSLDGNSQELCEGFLRVGAASIGPNMVAHQYLVTYASQGGQMSRASTSRSGKSGNPNLTGSNPG